LIFLCFKFWGVTASKKLHLTGLEIDEVNTGEKLVYFLSRGLITCTIYPTGATGLRTGMVDSWECMHATMHSYIHAHCACWHPSHARKSTIVAFTDRPRKFHRHTEIDLAGSCITDGGPPRELIRWLACSPPSPIYASSHLLH
jgi:hypothetical protein